MLKNLTPNFYAESVFDLDLDDLKAKGITTVMSDLDNTLVGWDEKAVPQRLHDWVAKVHDAGLKFILVSNATEKRMAYYRRELDVEGIAKANKPLSRAFLRAISDLGVTVSQTAMIGDQIFTDVLGANRLGIYTILVVPLTAKDMWVTRIVRQVERFVLRRLIAAGKLKGKTSDSH